MSGFFFALTVLAMLAVLATLAIGVFGMAKGGAFNRKYGNKLMRMRVVLQGVALALLAIAVVTLKK